MGYSSFSILRKAATIAALASFAAFTGLAGTATAIPVGYTCIGTCGTSGANGVVTAPPGGSSYDWVSTDNSNSLGTQDLNLGGETNGSLLRSVIFSAAAGDALEFEFNYVTSDGAGFADYGWARLLDATLNEVALLFTARTTPGGDTAPGFGMPANDATLTPSSTPIIAGGPAWAPLGGSSGACYNTGCGYTGWIHSSYSIQNAGNYILEFGTVNWSDTLYESGLALAGATVAGEPIGDPDPDPIPEPAMLSLIGLGIAGGFRRIRSRRQAA